MRILRGQSLNYQRIHSIIGFGTDINVASINNNFKIYQTEPLQNMKWFSCQGILDNC